MRVFEVVIEGTRPILLHNPVGMSKKRPAKGGGTSIPTAEEEAEASCYWMPDGSSLMFPGDNIQSGMIAVSGRYKASKQSLTPYVSGSIQIEPEFIPFGTKKYAIDTRRAVVQRQGIMRSRAKLLAWKLAFRILVDDDFPLREAGDTLRAILEEVGRRAGIGDFRPQKRGKFGKFIVIKFVEIAVK